MASAGCVLLVYILCAAAASSRAAADHCSVDLLLLPDPLSDTCAPLLLFAEYQRPSFHPPFVICLISVALPSDSIVDLFFLILFYIPAVAIPNEPNFNWQDNDNKLVYRSWLLSNTCRMDL
ncbi:uncharacterized protein LOC129312376 [Prosopis cineraria]|uniref:uncharacterized protein LOC129312376 n=1 Tax=Prosopis cineraria TaxID=364024 RepID=UPI0024108861|nr:uncharacterized protein LOC129312376 [Prosopis cineraria]